MKLLHECDLYVWRLPTLSEMSEGGSWLGWWLLQASVHFPQLKLAPLWASTHWETCQPQRPFHILMSYSHALHLTTWKAKTWFSLLYSHPYLFFNMMKVRSIFSRKKNIWIKSFYLSCHIFCFKYINTTPRLSLVCDQTPLAKSHTSLWDVNHSFILGPVSSYEYKMMMTISSGMSLYLIRALWRVIHSIRDEA